MLLGAGLPVQQGRTPGPPLSHPSHDAAAVRGVLEVSQACSSGRAETACASWSARFQIRRQYSALQARLASTWSRRMYSWKVWQPPRQSAMSAGAAKVGVRRGGEEAAAPGAVDPVLAAAGAAVLAAVGACNLPSSRSRPVGALRLPCADEAAATDAAGGGGRREAIGAPPRTAGACDGRAACGSRRRASPRTD